MPLIGRGNPCCDAVWGGMLTIIMECRDDEAELAQTLSALVSGAVEGIVRDVIVLDHGSSTTARATVPPRWPMPPAAVF